MGWAGHTHSKRYPKFFLARAHTAALSQDSPHPPGPHLRVHTTCSPHLGHEKAQSKRLSQPFTHLMPCILRATEACLPTLGPSADWRVVQPGLAGRRARAESALQRPWPGLPAHTTTHCNHTSHSTTILNHLLYGNEGLCTPTQPKDVSPAW